MPFAVSLSGTLSLTLTDNFRVVGRSCGACAGMWLLNPLPDLLCVGIAVLLGALRFARLHAPHAGIPFVARLPETLTLLPASGDTHHFMRTHGRDHVNSQSNCLLEKPSRARSVMSIVH
eukprot:283310-Chlamydomonas_euryale.AAC.7